MSVSQYNTDHTSAHTMTGVTVSPFFAPSTSKRPPNFVVVKYFLLGLLISNSIESVLIIPKILDVLDQSEIQTKRFQEMDVKRAEVKELLEEKQRESASFHRERDREFQILEEARGKQRVSGKDEKHGDEEKGETHAERAKTKKHHLRKSHREEESDDETREEEEEAEEEAAAEEETDEREAEKKAEEKEKQVHREVHKRPQRFETGNNYVAVFMLFYGSTTLCLGVPAIFKESVRLLQGLIGVSCFGILILVSSKFSIIMIMSVIKDITIVALTLYYIQMISSTDAPAVATVDSSVNPFTGTVDATVPVNTTVLPNDAINTATAFTSSSNTIPVDYAAVAAQQHLYPATGQAAW